MMNPGIESLAQARNVVPPALKALFTLDEAAKEGQVQMTTPQGIPTVAAQKAQQATQAMMPAQPAPATQPGMGAPVQQAAQQAGLGGQIQQQQLQQAQQAMMQQAMQNRPPAGIEGLNPQMGGFADGGIVGYAKAGEAEDTEAPDAQAEADRAAMLNTLKKLGAAGMDIATLPGRAALGALESVVTRPLRALGVPIPYLPSSVYGGDVSSMTPYYDKLRAEQAAREQAGQKYTPTSEDVQAMLGQQGYTGTAPKSLAPPVGGAPRAQAVSGEAGVPNFLSEVAKDRAKLADLVKQYANVKEPVPEDIQNRIDQNDKLIRQLAASRGIDADYLAKQAEQVGDYYKRRDELLMQREQETKAQLDPTQQLKQFLLGARGTRLGQTMAGGAERAMAYEEGVTRNIRSLQDLRLELEGLKIEKLNSINALRYATVTGDVAKAKQELENLAKIDRESKKVAIEAQQAGMTAAVHAAGVQETSKARAFAAQQGIEAKLQQQLAQNMKNLETVALDVDRKFKDDPRVKAYQALSMTGKVAKEIEDAYKQAVSERDIELKTRGANITKEVQRLQNQIYGAGAFPVEAPAPMYATNPKTGQRIVSTDGGKTWNPAR